MTSLVIELPDELARDLERIAAAESKTVQELAVERLRTAIEDEPAPGTLDAIRRAMREPPHVTAADVAELEAAIASGKLPPERLDDLFPE